MEEPKLTRIGFSCDAFILLLTLFDWQQPTMFEFDHFAGLTLKGLALP